MDDTRWDHGLTVTGEGGGLVGHAAVGVLGRTAVVDLAVAVTYGDPIHQVARDIQRRVIATLRENLGLQTIAVNVTVEDILTGDDQ
jgi:uncharacterized alkaline shock family protein YloU